MIKIRAKDTKLGPVELLQDDDNPLDFYVKVGESWAIPLNNTAAYPKKPKPLSYDDAMNVFEEAVYDNEMVYEATKQ